MSLTHLFPSETPKMKVKSELDEEMSMANRLNAQRLGVTLRKHLLKLPKAHKWVFLSFYSTIDKVLSKERMISVCLRESLPSSKTRRLARE